MPESSEVADGPAVQMIQCLGCGTLLADVDAFAKHCQDGNAPHDDDFAAECKDVIVDAGGVVTDVPEMVFPIGPIGPAPARTGVLSEEEAASGVYSPIELRAAPEGGGPQFAFIAPGEEAKLSRRVLPTVLAISGEEQCHVSKYFRAWRAEVWEWQVIVPLRSESGTPYLFEPEGIDLVVQLMRRLIAAEAECPLVLFGIEGHKFHLVGTSNGGASVLAVAAKAPELVASLTLVTGFVPRGLHDLSPLAAIPDICLYVGDADEMGHCEALQELKQRLDSLTVPAELHVLPGARHFNIGHYIDMDDFWNRLEAARRPQVASDGEPRQE